MPVISIRVSECKVHAHVLMTNHVHLLVTPEDVEGVSWMMQSIGRRYVRYINHVYLRTGTLWEGRYKAGLVAADHNLLACYHYIKMNPVRTRMAERPENYKWSSYGCNALGVLDEVVVQHLQYLALGKNEMERQAAYKVLFKVSVDPKMIGSSPDRVGRKVNHRIAAAPLTDGMHAKRLST